MINVLITISIIPLVTAYQLSYFRSSESEQCESTTEPN